MSEEQRGRQREISKLVRGTSAGRDSCEEWSRGYGADPGYITPRDRGDSDGNMYITAWVRRNFTAAFVINAAAPERTGDIATRGSTRWSEFRQGG